LRPLKKVTELQLFEKVIDLRPLEKSPILHIYIIYYKNVSFCVREFVPCAACFAPHTHPLPLGRRTGSRDAGRRITSP
jgi:hypothetical protein